MTHYDTLGVSKSADTHTIRQAYRKKAKRAHPDKGGSAHEMAALNRAYACLSDHTARARYDSTGTDSAAPSLEQQAQTALISLVNQLLDQTQEGQDLISLCKQRVTQEQNEIKAKQTTLKQQIVLLKRRQRRLTYEGPHNLIGDLIASRIQQAEQNISQLDNALACSTLALKMLGEYSYSADTPPSHPWMTVTSTSTSSGMGCRPIG